MKYEGIDLRFTVAWWESRHSGGEFVYSWFFTYRIQISLITGAIHLILRMLYAKTQDKNRYAQIVK